MTRHADVPVNPLEAARERVKALMENALAALGMDPVFALERAPEGKGDISAPIFLLSKAVKRPPPELAREVAAKIIELTVNSDGIILDIRTDGPYVNFHVNDKDMVRMTLRSILGRRELYGWLRPRSEKMIIEHTSANPTGPLHVGRARNPIIGDTLARIFRMGGYDVETQYWVNDMGRQAVILHTGITRFGKDEASDSHPDLTEKPDHVYVRCYQLANEQMSSSEAFKEEVQQMLRSIEGGDRGLTDDVMASAEKVLEGIRSTLETLNIKIDRFVRESNTLFDGTAQRVVSMLKASPNAKMDDGAHYLDIDAIEGGTPKDPRDRNHLVFTRKDGTTLYTTRDLAYHLYKLDNCDIAINVLGEDHRLQSKQLAAALRVLGTRHVPDTVFYSFVGLPAGEKMSTRKGTVVYIDDLYDETLARASKIVQDKARERGEELTKGQMEEIACSVAVGAVRFNIIRVQAEKNIVFKWEEALTFDGCSAPFVQYAHTRCCGILRNAAHLKGAGEWRTVCEEGLWDWDPEMLAQPAETALIRVLARFPDTVYNAMISRAGHAIASYAHEVAIAFNQFYRDVPVLKTDDESARNSRLALVDATRLVLRNSLWALGIDAPERM